MVKQPAPVRPSPRPRACDACYSVKERCTYPASDVPCTRCTRLAKECTSSRPVMPRPGRPRLLPPKNINTIAPIAKAPSKQAIPRPPRVVLIDNDAQSPNDVYILTHVFNADSFAIFMTAPNIGKDLHRQAVHTFLLRQEDMHDGICAMYDAFYCTISGTAINQTNLRRSTRALSKFQSMPAPTDQDSFSPWLWLGLCIYIHVHCSLGTNGAPIRQHMLSQIAALGPEGEVFHSHPIIISFITLDIFDSLLSCHLPILNLPDNNPLHIDSFMGLLHPLMHMMYELCIISHNHLHHKSPLNALHSLETKIKQWHPTPASTSTFHTLSTSTSTHILTQARVYQSMLLLYIHRLRYPFGEEDTQASIMADSIIADIESTTNMTGTPVKYVTLPFLIASVEAHTPEQRQRCLDGVGVYKNGISSVSNAMTRNFLLAVWKRRDEKPAFRWMEVVGELPPISVNMYNY